MTVKSAAHFVDADITGTSGLDDWESNSYEYPAADITKTGITTTAGWLAMNDDLDGDYELLNNLDFSGVDYTPIGNGATIPDKFRGTLDGNFFTISNISITAGDNGLPVGVFQGGDGVTIENLIVENINITIPTDGSATGSGYGLLVCSLTSSNDASFQDNFITQCRATGTITRGTSIGVSGGWGGLIGTCSQHTSGATTKRTFITRCSSDVVMVSLAGMNETTSPVGGLVSGPSGAIIIDCYSTGTITTSVLKEINGGGFGGISTNVAVANQTTITNCYSAIAFSGKVGGTVGGFWSQDKDFIGAPVVFNLYADCFWDDDIAPTGFNDTGNRGDVSDVTGETTVNMFKEATFTDWDFTDVWEIDEDVSYPTHQWLTTDPNKIKTGEQHRTTAMPTDHAHLNGQTVQGLGDGSFLGTEVVAGGDVTMDDATTVNHVGLQYTSTILPMKIDGEVNVKRISKIIPNVNETVGGDYGRSIAKLTSMVLRSSNDPLDTDSALFTGHVDLPFDGTYDRSADIYITQDEPFPFKLLGLGVDMSQENI